MRAQRLQSAVTETIWRKTAGGQSPMKDKKVEAVTKVQAGLQVTKIPGPQSNAKQLVVRRVNWNDNKELAELQAAENFCRFTGHHSWKLEARGQNDPVDITARSPEGASEDLQIVRLWEKNDWRQLNTKDAGAVDRCYNDQEAVELFRKVLGSKGVSKYPAAVRKKLTLLIDANPVARLSDFVAGIENAIKPFASQAGYKEVWAVGTEDVRKLA